MDKCYALENQGSQVRSPAFPETLSVYFGCSRHKISTQIINHPGPVLVTTQGKPTKVFSNHIEMVVPINWYVNNQNSLTACTCANMFLELPFQDSISSNLNLIYSIYQ